MKRLKYTRRFVNVQLTGGKRKVRSDEATEGWTAHRLRATHTHVEALFIDTTQQMNPNPTS